MVSIKQSEKLSVPVFFLDFRAKIDLAHRPGGASVQKFIDPLNNLYTLRFEIRYIDFKLGASLTIIVLIIIY